MKNKMIAALLAVAAIAGLTACGSSSTDSSSSSTIDTSDAKIVQLTKDSLEDGKYYVMHNDGTFDELYLGYGTINGDRSGDYNEADYDRIAWFQNDFGKIPTLYGGNNDALVYYTTGAFDEKFSFERFYDLGYSVGLRGLSRTETGRIQVSTQESDNTTYPDSDCDQILTYSGDTDTVIIDKIDDKDVFTSTQTDAADKTLYGADSPTEEQDDNLISKYGTIKGLEKDSVHRFYIHAGTPLATGSNGSRGMDLKANVRILGSAEGAATYKYAFDSENNVVKIGLPDFFHAGYYVVDNVGMFRYIPKGSENIDIDNYSAFNVPNPIPSYTQDGESNGSSSSNAEGSALQMSTRYDSFSISDEQVGVRILVKVNLSTSDGSELNTDGMSAYVQTPAGDSYPMTISNGTATATLITQQAGDYSIVYTSKNNSLVTEATVDIVG